MYHKSRIFNDVFLNDNPLYSAGMRGPPTSGAPPVSAAQPYSQFGQSDVQNGPPSMGAPPQRSRFGLFVLRDVFFLITLLCNRTWVRK